ncbi:hypothetical protein PM082_009605 [Marasmius tenuissimus]|nr:hypothetical protein PM082_009605 [Marasmius tenuissimus]
MNVLLLTGRIGAIGIVSHFRVKVRPICFDVVITSSPTKRSKRSDIICYWNGRKLLKDARGFQSAKEEKHLASKPFSAPSPSSDRVEQGALNQDHPDHKGIVVLIVPAGS